MSKEPQQVGQNNEIVEKYQRLLADVKAAENVMNWWTRILSDPLMEDFTKVIEDEIQQSCRALETCDKKDLDRYQAEVSAKRNLLSRMRGNQSDVKVQAARERLKEFRRDNEMFLSSYLEEQQTSKKAVAS